MTQENGGKDFKIRKQFRILDNFMKILIESTMLGTLIKSYYYCRINVYKIGRLKRIVLIKNLFKSDILVKK